MKEDRERAVPPADAAKYLSDLVHSAHARLESAEPLESVAAWLLKGPAPWPIDAIKVLWQAGVNLPDAKLAVDAALAVSDPEQIHTARTLREDVWLAWAALPPDQN